ncbi:MAG TPA: MmcQ/YjbR family DNA-binding protein [Mycobacterium sp.]|nr:MmcQ/YjbR family DNA-binding protein [Mycobacterium sp.]
MATWDDVVRIVGELPLTEEASPHDWRVGKKLMAWERPLRKSDREAFAARRLEPPSGDILGVRVADEGVKFALIADEPRVYFTTPHFDGYPAVLVKLAEIDVVGLRELITEAWLTQAPNQLVKEYLGDATGPARGRLPAAGRRRSSV